MPSAPLLSQRLKTYGSRQYHQLVITLVVSFAFTALLMPWLIELCRQKGLYDQPNERKVHHNKIPRLGGLLSAPAMSIGIVAGFLYLGVSVESSQLPVFRLSTMILMAGLFLIYLIGVLDDLLGLSARVKFAVQVAASAFMPLCGLYINNLYGLFGLWEIPFWAGSALTVFACLLIVNSVNLIDGIDGLSSGLSMLALTAFAALFWELGVESYTLVSLGLIGAVAAFFFFNVFGSERRGTKTFMGDTGSLVLGYTLAYLSIKYAMNNPSVLAPRPHGMVVVITLLAVPVFDLVRVACMRLVHGKGIFHPDKTHIHHLALAAGCSMSWALVLIVALQLLIMAVNVLLVRLAININLLLLVDVLLYGALITLLRRQRDRIAAAHSERRP